MDNSNLKPLNDRELSRIEYYCKRIGLTKWDVKDITAFLVTRRNISILIPTFDPIYINATSEFKSAKSKIIKLGLMDVVDEFGKYLSLESEYFEDYKKNNSNLIEDEIWAIIYHKIDTFIDQGISSAKDKAKANKVNNVGCLLILSVIFSIGYYFIT